MAKRVILHVGPPKTGTSAIQAAMDQHRKRLAAEGIGYWSAGRAHSAALPVALGESPADLPSWRRRKLPAGDLRAGLLAELAASETFVLSANISGYAPQRLRALLDLTSSDGAEVVAVYYVREPRAHLTSIVQQNLKGGLTIARALAEAEPPAARLERLYAAFGSGGMQVRAYRGRGLVSDFLTAIGVPAALAEALTPTIRNESLSHEAAMMMDAVQTLAAAEGEQLAFGNALAKMLRAELPGPRFQLPQSAHAAYLARYAVDLDRVSARLGEDVLGLPSSVAPPPEVPPADPRYAKILYALARRLADDRASRPDVDRSLGRGGRSPGEA